MSSTCTTAMIATRPSSTKRKTHASAKHCWKPSVFKHVVRCACHDREACFNPYKLLFSCTSLPDSRPQPLGRRRKTSLSSLDWTKACSTSKWHTSRSSSQAIALNKRTQELETVGANVSPKSIHSRCLNPRATSLDFALLTQPNSSDFQLNNHLTSITLPIGCYAGSNVLTYSRPRNFRALELRHTAACSDESAPAMVDEVGTSLAGAVRKSASGGGSSCSRKASSNASRVAIPCAKAAWDIRPMLRGDSRIARVSPRVRPGIRTLPSCPSSRTTRSRIGAVGFRDGAGAALSDAGTGTAAGAVVAAGAGWMYMYSGVAVPDGNWGTSDPTVGAGEINGSRGWCHVTSCECTIRPVSASMIFTQSLPWLCPNFKK